MNFDIPTISFLSTIFPLGLGFYLFKKIDRTFRLFLFLLVIGFLFDITSQYLGKHKMHATQVLNAYTFFESIYFVFFFFEISPFKEKRKLIAVFITFYILVWAFTYNLTNHFYAINKYARSIESVIIIAFLGILLIHESNYSKTPLYKNALFCFASILIVYFSISLAVFSIADLIFVDSPSPSPIAKLWLIPTWLNLITNILLSYTFWCNSQTTK